MSLEARIKRIEAKLGSRKPTTEELLRTAWERFLKTARGEEIEVNGEMDQHLAAWMDFLLNEGETIEIDMEGAWRRLIGKEDPK